MSNEDKLILLKLELNITTEKVNKFKQLNDDAFLNRVRYSKREVINYCNYAFHNPSRTPPKHLLSSDGKIINIYCSGHIAFKGKITYLKRWFDAQLPQFRLRTDIKHLDRQIKGLTPIKYQ